MKRLGWPLNVSRERSLERMTSRITQQGNAADAHVFRAAAESVPLDGERLAAYLAGIGLPLDASDPIKQFGTGLANINYRLTAGGRRLVLRRPPGGELPPGAHDMAREHRILSRLWRVHPLAPESLHLCEDKSVVGVPFQLIDYRPGLVIKGDDQSRFAGRPDVARATSTMLIETLISVHRVDCAAIGLDTLGKPEGFIARAIKGWVGRGARLDVAPATARLLAEAGAWLERQPVQTRAPVLLHSDLKLDNMIVHPETLAPVAIVDWDMGTRGDPLFDLATTLSYWVEPGDPPCMHALRQMPTTAPGFATRAEVLSTYKRAMNVDVSDWPVLRVLAMLKLAVVLLQLFALYQRGAAKGSDYADLDQVATELLAYAIDVAHGRAD
jgi:aminoglycoside phosphotransferase (APT) family kinase protein